MKVLEIGVITILVIDIAVTAITLPIIDYPTASDITRLQYTLIAKALTQQLALMSTRLAYIY